MVCPSAIGPPVPADRFLLIVLARQSACGTETVSARTSHRVGTAMQALRNQVVQDHKTASAMIEELFVSVN